MKDGGYQSEASYSTDERVHPLVVDVLAPHESCGVAGGHFFDGFVDVKQTDSVKGLSRRQSGYCRKIKDNVFAL